MPIDAAQIAENVAPGPRADCRGRRREAAGAADAVTLVAVTKYVSAEVVRLLVEAGCRDLGESRPQQLWEKAAALADLPIRWHLVGHLQRNKVRRTLPLVAMIHSVDSPRLLAAIDEELGGGADILSAGQQNKMADRMSAPPAQSVPHQEQAPLPVLLEVNISGEAAKHGFAPDEIEPFVGGTGRLSARGGSRADVHGGVGGRAGRCPARFRRPARTPRPLAWPLPAGRDARRAFDGHERRFRVSDRRRRDDRPRRLGAVRGRW